MYINPKYLFDNSYKENNEVYEKYDLREKFNDCGCHKPPMPPCECHKPPMPPCECHKPPMPPCEWYQPQMPPCEWYQPQMPPCEFPRHTLSPLELIPIIQPDVRVGLDPFA